MDVIATRQGTYGGRPREIGERFTLVDPADKGSWMAEVGSEDAEGVSRQREPLATPARAETGPNPGIAASYAEAGFQTTALLLELQDLRVENGALKTQAAEAEALRRRVDELEAQLENRSETAGKAADKATEKAVAAARKEAVEQHDAAVEAANEAREDQNRSEDGAAVEAVPVDERPEPPVVPTEAEGDAERAAAAEPDGDDGTSRRTRRLRRT